MGFYVRYAENINIIDAEIKAIKPDARPIILACKNVIELFFNNELIIPTQNEKK
jgi:hypothetical protein